MSTPFTTTMTTVIADMNTLLGEIADFSVVLNNALWQGKGYVGTPPVYTPVSTPDWQAAGTLVQSNGALFTTFYTSLGDLNILLRNCQTRVNGQ